MSDSDSDLSQNKEYRILRAMRRVLTGVIKDTAAPPGMKHPLSDDTVEDIRQCLMLISARERELSEAAGRPMSGRPHFVDEPATSVVVPLSQTGLVRRKPKDPE